MRKALLNGSFMGSEFQRISFTFHFPNLARFISLLNFHEFHPNLG